MKALGAAAAAGLVLIASLGSASSQPWGGRDYGYGQRDYGYGQRRYDDDDEYEERRPRYRERAYGFDSREYLRCNPDVRRAVMRGETTPLQHYQQFGRREGRRLSC